jgi:serine protease Do
MLVWPALVGLCAVALAGAQAWAADEGESADAGEPAHASEPPEAAETPGGEQVQPADLEAAFTQLLREAEPAVVTVYAESSAGENLRLKLIYGTERIPQGLGSGFIIDRKGYLITNEHVVRGGELYTVLMSDGRRYDGKVVGKDQLLDIALMRIVVPEEEQGRTFPTLKLGDSDAVEPGMWAVAVGNPIGSAFDDAEPVMTLGVVSGINRTFVDTLADRREGLRTYGGLIQTDAAVNPGNSGGPLFNLDGQVIGVNTLGFAPTDVNVGINFAVPINSVKRKLGLLAKGYGVRRPMRYGTIDAYVETLDEYQADVLHLRGRRGVYVKQVFEDGAAAAAGIQDKDVILGVAGQRVVNAAQFVCLVAHFPVGDTVPFEVWRVVEDTPQTIVINVTLSGKTITELEAAPLRSPQ